MRKCKKCGLPVTFKGIHIDKNGVCNYCNFFEEKKVKILNYQNLEKDFLEELENAKKQAQKNGSDYDCLVGLSGGKDSTYIIYKLKNDYGMRVLAYTFDNGFSTDYARNNIKNALEKLDVDYMSVSMKESELRRYYTAFMKLMHNFCSVCFHFMHYYSHKIAYEKKIPLIVNGRTIGQILQTADSEKGIEPFQISNNLKEFEYQMFGKLTDKLEQQKFVEYLNESRVRSLSYFAYHNVSEEETMDFLEKRINWKRPDKGTSHPDCWAHALAEKLNIEKCGYPVRTGELAVLVRAGKISKEEMEEILSKDMDRYREIDSTTEKRFYERIKYRKCEEV
ncbi:adenine nucleotide alpha hydrolase family protein [Anaerosacchariphilus polymeriproducens]|uniref:N-acetyl sugar amidotransferase n=1 Tax=Anaerosacchariphilus polymeriproducens TaxID=1812858 RepID=A0A371AT02_9FIRM|nr:hypothetical protein [Anaerosacchariphilus polymeriproducens]RDU22704.1 hypothetical protein DWV06_13100 [Anaerosacchariphilus polymeriproducens]